MKTKRVLCWLLVAVMMLGILPVSGFALEISPDTQLDEAVSGRQVVDLNGTWTFTDPDSGTSSVEVPHGWDNYKSASNLAANIKICTYEKVIDVSAYQGKALFLQFDGVNKTAEIYVDDEYVDTHVGGFSAFTVNITDYCEGKDQVTVKVDVTNMDFNTMPVNSDFTHFGGIYRDVRLIAVDKVAYISNEDYGSNGVYVSTDVDLSTGSASLSTIVMVGCGAELLYGPEEAVVSAVVKDADGNVVGSTQTTVEISGKETAKEVVLGDIEVTNAHLWNGTIDPYLYTVEVSVSVNDIQMDTASVRVGLRSYEVKDATFYLNGEVYELRGVGMHQDYGAMTNATTDQQKYEDIQLVLEMGANALRTSHYPHDQYIYDLCDEYGIVVWCEIPFYLIMLNTDEFKDNTTQCALEMVKQGYNHPSIIVWGLQNEVNIYPSYSAYYPTQATAEQLSEYMIELAETVQTVDPSRLIGQATIDNNGYAQETATWTTAESEMDVVGFNIYQGWYGSVNGATEDNKVNRFATALKNRMATFEGIFDEASGNTVSYVLTEYGAGANVEQHDDLGEDFVWNGTSSTRGQYHPEEYQSYIHEGMIMAIYGDEIRGVEANDSLWAAFAWAMFDFSCYRNEGGTVRLNTKGLVTADRQTKKDAFYLYKANWNDTDYFTHICSSRYTVRDEQYIDVKVYSNCDSVELFVDGVSYGNGTLQQTGVFTWSDVKLNPGNSVEAVAVGTKDGETYTDTCNSWTCHVEGEWTVTKQANCFTDGEETQSCTICETVLATRTIAKYVCDGTAANCDSLLAGLTDVSAGSWYHNHVDCIVDRGIMIGVTQENGSIMFEPNTTTTRAMLVQMIYRMECDRKGVDKLEYTYDGSLSDLKGNEWFAEAAMWANDTGVLNGRSYTDSIGTVIKFDGNETVTRQELAVLLYRYIGEYRGINTDTLGDISKFEDAADVQDYALTAMQWVVGNGIVEGQGKGETNPTDAPILLPGADGTRAEIATMFHRMIELVIEPTEVN